MTAKNSRDHSTIKRIVAIPLFILLAVTITFSQETKPAESSQEEKVSSDKNDWWKPIIEKHNIEITAYNNFEHVFEMGSTNSIEDGVVTLTDALFIIRNSGDQYTIVKSPIAYHYLSTNIIKGEEGSLEVYDSEYGNEPKAILETKGFEYQVYSDAGSVTGRRISAYGAKNVKGPVSVIKHFNNSEKSGTHE